MEVRLKVQAQNWRMMPPKLKLFKYPMPPPRIMKFHVQFATVICILQQVVQYQDCMRRESSAFIARKMGAQN